MSTPDAPQHLSYDTASQGLYHNPPDAPQNTQSGYQQYQDPGLYHDPQKAQFQHAPEYSAPGGQDAVEARDGKTICGLSQKWFVTLAAIVIVVVVAGAVGGGVGGAMVRKNRDNSSSSNLAQTSATSQTSSIQTPASSPASSSTSTSSISTSISTSSTSRPRPTTAAEASTFFDCPFPDATEYTPPNSTKLSTPLNEVFQMYCDSDIGLFNGLPERPEDISSFQDDSVTLKSCIDACVEHNMEYISNGKLGSSPCAAVALTVFIPTDLRRTLRCWLKSQEFGKLTVYKHGASSGDVVVCAKMKSV